MPAFNESGMRSARVVTALRAARAAGTKILVVDDGSTRRHRRARRAAAGARVVRHPYNKGNGAAVKTGIRAGDRRVRS